MPYGTKIIFEIAKSSRYPTLFIRKCQLKLKALEKLFDLTKAAFEIADVDCINKLFVLICVLQLIDTKVVNIPLLC